MHMWEAFITIYTELHAQPHIYASIMIMSFFLAPHCILKKS